MDIIKTIEEKEFELAELYGKLRNTEKEENDVKVINQKITDKWSMYNGDCVEVIKGLPNESVHYSIFSPPFLSLYVYSDSERDMGNSKNDDDFYSHFEFLIPQLMRVLLPGRLVSVHCSVTPLTIQHDGVIGLKDFPGMLVRLFQKFGFVFHSKFVIWKDPLIQATRTKMLSLAHKQVIKDSTRCGHSFMDEILTFRKPGENKEPVSHEAGFEEYVGESEPKEKKNANPKLNKYSQMVFRSYASPVWFDIDQTDTLNYRLGKEEKDERHICLARGSLVLTQRGFIEIQNVEIGDLVLTHLGNWQPIIAKECTGINKVIKTHAQGVPHLVTTPSHKLWARRVTNKTPKKSMKSHAPEWIESKDMAGNYVNLKLPEIIESEFSEQEWWIVGRYLADGHVGGHVRREMQSFHISVGNNKIDDFLLMAGDFVGTSHRASDSCIQYRLKNLSLNLRKLLWNKCGHVAIEKQVPIEGLCLGKDKADALLSGYLSGDGHKDKYGRWHCASISRKLLLGMAMAAQRARNIIPSIYKSKSARKMRIEGREVNAKQLWVMMFNDNPKYTFSEILDDGAWKKTRKIENYKEDETWSIRVANDESFTAEGCIVKNCPLQLQVIERCLHYWTNPGDIVLSPFAGIGSEGYESIRSGRKFIGIELKQSYYNLAIRNLQKAEKIKEARLKIK